MRVQRLSFLFLVGTLFSAVVLRAATFTAASCNLSDVQAAFNAANNGDTVIIPNGNCTWTSGLDATSKQITISGQSESGVVITDNNPTAETGTNCSGALFCLQTGSSYHVQLANITFLPGTATGDYVIMKEGTGTPLVPLMHDVSFNIPNFQITHAVQWLVTGGVIWNATFVSTNNTSGACGTQVGSDSGSIVFKGNRPWDSADTMGTADTNGTINTYVEDSTFSYVGQIPDCDDNCRIVMRHNTFTNISGGLTHGPTSTYGGRHVELYNNTYSTPNSNRNISRYFWWRGGTGVVTNNSISAISGGCYSSRASMQFIVESATRAQSHGCCTGYACWHQPGSGTVAGVSGACSGTSPTSCLDSSQSPDAYQELDPIYMWNNSGTGDTESLMTSTNDSSTGGCSTGNTTATFFHSGRDYYYDGTHSATSGAKPGWAPYSYPHPLRQGVGPTPAPPPPPTNLQATVS